MPIINKEGQPVDESQFSFLLEDERMRSLAQDMWIDVSQENAGALLAEKLISLDPLGSHRQSHPEERLDPELKVVDENGEQKMSFLEVG